VTPHHRGQSTAASGIVRRTRKADRSTVDD